MEYDFFALCDALNISVCQGEIVDALLSNRALPTLNFPDWPALSEADVRSMMHRLGFALKRFGVEVSHECGVGYFLDEESRNRICAKLNQISAAA